MPQQIELTSTQIDHILDNVRVTVTEFSWGQFSQRPDINFELKLEVDAIPTDGVCVDIQVYNELETAYNDLQQVCERAQQMNQELLIQMSNITKQLDELDRLEKSQRPWYKSIFK